MNGTKALKDNSQDTNPSDSNSTTDTAKKYRFEFLMNFFLYKKNIFSILWDYAISVNMSSIVYLHCHQHGMKKMLFHI